MANNSASPASAQSRARVSAIIGLAVGFGWALIPGLPTRQITDIHNDIVNMCAKWLVTLILCIIAFSVQHMRRSALGVRTLRWQDGLAGIVAAAFALILSGAASRVVAIPSALSDLDRVAAVPLGMRIGVVLTAAVCEEFMYRGFAIEELALLTGKRWLGALLSWLLFSVTHVGIYGLSAALLIPALVGAVLTGQYLWRRNLPSCVLTHAIVDGVFIILVPAAMHAH
jgi:CAAX protease family protein